MGLWLTPYARETCVTPCPTQPTPSAHTRLAERHTHAAHTLCMHQGTRCTVASCDQTIASPGRACGGAAAAAAAAAATVDAGAAGAGFGKREGRSTLLTVGHAPR
jgi:hypothetical protein